MKKLFIFMLAIMVACFCIPIVNASDTQSIEHYSVTNATATLAHTHIGVTTIYPGKDRILGFTVCPITSGTGTVGVGLYDATTDAQMSAANLLGEVMGVNTATHEKTFAAPVPLANGLTVDVGPYSTVVIYYEITVGH
jgi:hypothetical protein